MFNLVQQTGCVYGPHLSTGVANACTYSFDISISKDVLSVTQDMVCKHSHALWAAWKVSKENNSAFYDVIRAVLENPQNVRAL